MGFFLGFSFLVLQIMYLLLLSCETLKFAWKALILFCPHQCLKPWKHLCVLRIGLLLLQLRGSWWISVSIALRQCLNHPGNMWEYSKIKCFLLTALLEHQLGETPHSAGNGKLQWVLAHKYRCGSDFMKWRKAPWRVPGLILKEM